MDFDKRKLPVEATSKLRMCPIESVKPFALMIAPVYVYMRRNEKFIAVKAPLDFFTAEELSKLRSMEMFFMPEFVDSVIPYRNLARRAKMILGWNPVESKIALPPAPFELSDAVLRLTATLWGREFAIEPFFVCVFANELCSLLPGDEMAAAREKDLLRFERAVILSAWMVFLSLHSGATDPQYLDRLRLSVFREVLGIQQESSGSESAGVLRLDSVSDAGELFRILDQKLAGELVYRSIGLEFFEDQPERIAQKIVTRIKRIQSESLRGPSPLEGTIYGEHGFAAGGSND